MSTWTRHTRGRKGEEPVRINRTVGMDVDSARARPLWSLWVLTCSPRSGRETKEHLPHNALRALTNRHLKKPYEEANRTNALNMITSHSAPHDPSEAPRLGTLHDHDAPIWSVHRRR